MCARSRMARDDLLPKGTLIAAWKYYMRVWINPICGASRNSATRLFNMEPKVDDRYCGGVVMKTRATLLGSLVLCLLAVCDPAFAHHAWHGYDMDNLTSVKGIVTQFDWGNPHVW